MESSDIISAVIAVILGFVVGIIINALADDLPFRRSPSLPHYPNGVPRPLIAWSGLLAFLTGNREGPSIEYSPEEEKRRDLSLEEIANLAYDTVLSWRHPLTELAMMGIFAFTVLYYDGNNRVPVWMVFLSILMLITIIDFEHRLVLFVVIIPSLVVTFTLNILIRDEKRELQDYVIGALAGGAIFYVFYLGGGLFASAISMARGRGLSEVAFGFGDVMLAILSGAMIGWQALTLSIFITVFMGAIGAILYIVWRMVQGKRYSAYTPLPYGPYIVFGTVIMMLFAEEARNILY